VSAVALLNVRPVRRAAHQEDATMTAAATATKPATAKANKPATAAKPTPKVITPVATKDTTPAAKKTMPIVTKTAVPPQVKERIDSVWATESERRFAVKAWKHATGIRKSQGTPHGLSKEQAAAIVARVSEFSR
jgi:hypothetical protein